MEFLVCMLIAAIFTGGRAASDIIHGVKGTTPPHLEKARLKAQRTPKTPRGRSSLAADKPRLRDVAAVYWGDAMADAISSHDRRRAEKAEQRAENERAHAAGEQPVRLRPSLKDRVKRLWRLLIEPVGEPKTAAVNDDRLQPAPDPDEPLSRPADAGAHTDPKENPMANVNTHEERTEQRAPGDNAARNGHVPASTVTAGAPTGEAVNYETTVAELEAMIERLRAHLDSVTAALASVQQAKADINNSQASYNPAAQAAASISEHMPALNVDAETVGHTGTVANALPPNTVNDMFDQLEVMEQALVEQRANAEVALGSAEQALKTVVEKYGDAHATVAGELAGDSRFLDSAAV